MPFKVLLAVLVCGTSGSGLGYRSSSFGRSDAANTVYGPQPYGAEAGFGNAVGAPFGRQYGLGSSDNFPSAVAPGGYEDNSGLASVYGERRSSFKAASYGPYEEAAYEKPELGPEYGPGFPDLASHPAGYGDNSGSALVYGERRSSFKTASYGPNEEAAYEKPESYAPYEEPASYGPASYKPAPYESGFGDNSGSGYSNGNKNEYSNRYSPRGYEDPHSGYGSSSGYSHPAPAYDEDSIVEVQKLTTEAENAIVKANKIIKRLGEKRSVKDIVEQIRQNTAHNQYEAAHIVFDNWKKALAILDRDGDGILTRYDLKTQHETTLPYWNKYIKEINGRPAIDLYSYMHLDADGDGIITREEFVRSVAGNFDSQIWEFCWIVGFAGFDTKQADGYLNAAELVDLSETHIQLLVDLH